MDSAGIYGRVSSERQEHEDTVQSQLAELRERAEGDGFAIWQEFIDEGYSRDDLVRPGLDRLRVETIIPPEGDDVKLRPLRHEPVEPQATAARAPSMKRPFQIGHETSLSEGGT